MDGYLSTMVNYFFLRADPFGIALTPKRELVTAWAVNLCGKFLTGGSYAV